MAWEMVDFDFPMERCAVPSGWIYRLHSNIVFVPSPQQQGEKVTPANTTGEKEQLIALLDKAFENLDELEPQYARGRLVSALRILEGEGEKVTPTDDFGAAYARGFREGFEVGRKK